MDLLEYTKPGRSPGSSGSPGQPSDGGPVAPVGGLYGSRKENSRTGGPPPENPASAASRNFRNAYYNLQVNRKIREGTSHPDRDAQLESIAEQVRSFQGLGQPVVSVDTKKKELVGDFRNAGREWQPEGFPEEVGCKDFKDEELGVIPYGVYDQTADEGWVSVGIDHDTAQFATETLRRWWSRMGDRVYPRATDLLVTADGGESNDTDFWSGNAS